MAVCETKKWWKSTKAGSPPPTEDKVGEPLNGDGGGRKEETTFGYDCCANSRENIIAKASDETHTKKRA